MVLSDSGSDKQHSSVDEEDDESSELGDIDDLNSISGLTARELEYIANMKWLKGKKACVGLSSKEFWLENAYFMYIILLFL